MRGLGRALFSEGFNLTQTSIAVTSGDPFLTNSPAVLDERLFVPAPHEGGRVVDPAGCLPV